MSIIPEVRVIKQECKKHGFVDHVIYPQCRQCQNEHLKRICEQARQNTKESPVNSTQQLKAAISLVRQQANVLHEAGAYALNSYLNVIEQRAAV